MTLGSYEFTRDDDSTVTIDYKLSPYDPGNISGPPDNCYPPQKEAKLKKSKSMAERPP